MSTLHVVFKVAGSEYALPAGEVLQMESFAGATPVPGARPWVSGIVQVRGRIVPVVDLRARFGLPPAERTLDTRLVVGTLGERAVALLVDGAREVIKLEDAQIKPPPEIVAREARGMVRSVAQVGSRLVMLLDFAKVIGEE
ncbi:MAG: chemotaxis protein CheW [Deltaproteobacteria bacterium]